MILNEEVYEKPIIAVLPIFNEKGKNQCKIIFQDGKEEIQDISLDAFIDSWFKSYFVDRKAKEARAKKLLEINRLLPLYISENLVLIPIKCMEEEGSKDGIYGYVRYQNIEYKENNTLGLGNNIKVPCLSSTANIEQTLNLAHLLMCVEIERGKSVYN